MDIVEFRTVDISAVESSVIDANTENSLFNKQIQIFGLNGAEICREAGGLSLLTLFSVTMWIHLKGGDRALQSLLLLCTALLQPNNPQVQTNGLTMNGGSLLVEPQPWKAYQHALKRTKRLELPLAPVNSLQLRHPELDIRAILQSTMQFQSLWDCGKEQWGRLLCVYHATTAEECPEVLLDGFYTKLQPSTTAASLPIQSFESANTATNVGLSEREMKKRKMATVRCSKRPTACS